MRTCEFDGVDVAAYLDRWRGTVEKYEETPPFNNLRLAGRTRFITVQALNGRQLADNDRRIIFRWRQGTRVSVAALDRMLTRYGLTLADYEMELWERRAAA